MMDEIFHDINSKLSLSDFSRNLDTKRVKAGKYYWHFALMYYCSDQNYYPYVLTNNYTDIFYRSTEIRKFILLHFDGYSTQQLKDLNLQDVQRNYQKKVSDGFTYLHSEIKDFILSNPQNYSKVNPQYAQLVALDFIDSKQPYLRSASSAYKNLLVSGNYFVNGNYILTDIRYLKPQNIHRFNSLLDRIIKDEYLFYTVSVLIDYYQNSYSEFSFFRKARGAMDALKLVIELEPDILECSDPQIAYEIEQCFIDKSGNPLSKQSIRKAIKRYRNKNV